MLTWRAAEQAHSAAKVIESPLTNQNCSGLLVLHNLQTPCP